MRTNLFLGALVALVLAFSVLVGCGGGGGGSTTPAPNPNPTPTVAPNPPTSVTATATGATTIHVAWSDNSSNEDGFRVRRAQGGGSFSLLPTTLPANTTSFDDSGLSASTIYLYEVLAYNAAGTIASTNQANATTNAVATTAPTAPSSLTATSMSSTQINLAWTDLATNEDGFKIERSTTSGSGFTQIATVGANTVAYSATGLTASTKYYFKIRAYNAVGDSIYTSEANATTSAAITPNQWVSMSGGLPTQYAAVTSIVVNPSAATIVYVAFERSGIWKSTNSGTSWTQATGLGPTYVLAIDPSSPNTIYAGVEDARGVWTSTDGGISWTGSYPWVASGSIDVYYLAVSGGNRYTSVGSRNSSDAIGFYVNSILNTALSIANMGTSSQRNIGTSAIAVDPQTPSTLYVGQTDNTLMKSVNNGQSWARMSTGLAAPTGGYINAIVIDPKTPSTLYVATSGSVFKSVNGGTSWGEVKNGLPTSALVLRLAIDLKTPSTLYAVTDGNGVYKSVDSAASWIAFNTGLTSMNVTALTVDPVTPSILYVGTSDAGAFKRQ